MRKRTLLFIGMAGLVAFNSCKKDNNTNQEGEEQYVTSDIVDPGRLVAAAAKGKLDTLASDFGFSEGPAVDKQGNIYFTDQPFDKIFRWDAGTKTLSLFKQGAGRSNGMAFDKNGYLIACADMYGELWKIAPNGNQTVLINNYNGKLLNGPNDVWINPITGGLYITDPIFPRDYWTLTDPRRQGWEPTHSEQAATGKGGHVYYLAPGAKALVRVTSEAAGWDANSWPNGVVGTPDGKKLYVNKWAGNNMGGTWVFDVNADGTLTNMKKFNDMGGDGMSMDEKGNVYISNGLGITAFDPTGAKVLSIPIKGGATNNVFGGADNKTLFITGPSTKLTSIKMNVKGVEKF
ncbi:SMP-30/gluconolactonase/LRE family protein [Mucilaginibacter auburnensis]|uniref:Gluconolactonase n=1 Tax=Mucilaginibacter auburnensis TaxID=1457233 RepID=A0A2H9VTM5_9SPHI|nr:SMP-30/gluconolactonase/LRE family protein [Mucilaginibacter auburnensis]PJJ84168.1 gluconolactonase [Mucilaginibacter auburnensis]